MIVTINSGTKRLMGIEIPTLNMLCGRKTSDSELRACINNNTIIANRLIIFTFIDGYTRLAVQIRKSVSEGARKAVREISVVFSVHYAFF
jgi:hypothetical protein